MSFPFPYNPATWVSLCHDPKKLSPVSPCLSERRTKDCSQTRVRCTLPEPDDGEYMHHTADEKDESMEDADIQDEESDASYDKAGLTIPCSTCQISFDVMLE
jgi:hypothetical protein